MDKLSAAISIDMDNLWAYLRTAGRDEWCTYPCFFEKAVPRIRDFISTNKLSPTIFFIGQDLDSSNGESAARGFFADGIELANHSYSHRHDFHLATNSELIDEITFTENRIAAITNYKPVGFRGPSFQMTPVMLNTLIERGYRYDASSLPTSIGPIARAYHHYKHGLSGTSKKSRNQLFGGYKSAMDQVCPYRWVRQNGELIEIPTSVAPVIRVPLHFTYLNFLADVSPLLADFYFRAAIKICSWSGKPISLLLHATDFLGAEDELPEGLIPGMARQSDQKISFLGKLIAFAKLHYELRGLSAHIDALNNQANFEWRTRKITP